MDHEIQIRVRYQETDQMGVVYHGNYFAFFEIGRTEMLRAQGIRYKDMETAGEFCVVVNAECAYKKPAMYDDLLTLKTRVKKVTRVKIEHEHHLYRDNELLAVGHITLAVVDPHGNIQRVPDWMRPQQD